MRFKSPRLLSIFIVASIVSAIANANDHGGGDHGDGGGGGGSASTVQPVAIERVASPGAKEINVIEPGTDIRIPTEFWDLVTQEIKPTITFIPIGVTLKEKGSGILKDPETHIQFPRGGGEIDLAEYVKGKGSFFVSFDFPEEVPQNAVKVYFISQNRMRKVDGEILGSGCNKFFDIKEYYFKVKSKQGIEVNTTRLRHLSVLGGNFIFAFVLGKEIHMAQVGFLDSKNKEYFCDAVKTLNKDKDKDKDKDRETEQEKENEPAESL